MCIQNYRRGTLDPEKYKRSLCLIQVNTGEQSKNKILKMLVRVGQRKNTAQFQNSWTNPLPVLRQGKTGA